MTTIISIFFKTKNPWGVNDLLKGVNWGVLGGLHAMGGILGVMGAPEMGGSLGTINK